MSEDELGYLGLDGLSDSEESEEPVNKPPPEKQKTKKMPKTTKKKPITEKKTDLVLPSKIEKIKPSDAPNKIPENEDLSPSDYDTDPHSDGGYPDDLDKALEMIDRKEEKEEDIPKRTKSHQTKKKSVLIQGEEKKKKKEVVKQEVKVNNNKVPGITMAKLKEIVQNEQTVLINKLMSKVDFLTDRTETLLKEVTKLREANKVLEKKYEGVKKEKEKFHQEMLSKMKEIKVLRKKKK